MREGEIPDLEQEFRKVWKQFLKALPVIAFFLVLYYSVILFFGMKQVMIASLITVLFQVNYKKHPTVKTLLVLASQQLVIAIFSFLATLNLPLCVILNLLVPFWLIFTKASQFNQLGYFSTLMTFTFLQLMPVGWEGIGEQLQAMLYSLVFFFVIVYLYARRHRGLEGVHTEQKGLQLLASVLELLVKGEDTDKEIEELIRIQKSLYKEAYQKQGKKHVVTADGKLHYMFALLFQRSVYFVSGQYKEVFPGDQNAKDLALALAAYMKEAGSMDFWYEDTKDLRSKGRKLLRKARQQKNEYYYSVGNFLRMFLLILEQIPLEENQIMDDTWKMPFAQRIRNRFLYRMRLDTFEMRFALRMSIILIISMSYSMITQADHGYWLAMNAFLLLRPMYEESRYRMKTRFIGTAAGCVIMIFLLSFCQSPVSHFLLGSIMVACMYTATPGTRIHAVFVTCFALSMTTLAMGETLALELRMLYVAAAVVLVLVVNQFYFPTSLGSQFRYDWKMIFHMHHMYLRLLEDALRNPLNYWRICDAQIQYHMVYDQIEEYLPKVAEDERGMYRKILGISWRMVSEMEQMLFLVSQKRRGVQARQKMARYIYYTDYVLNQIQGILHLQKEKKIKNIEGMQYQRYIEGERELSVLMTQYAKNLSRLYVVVSRKYQI